MIELDIQVDTLSASLFLRGVNLKAVPVAEVRALNKVIVTVRKEAVQHIHGVRRMKKSTIRQQLQIVRASKRKPEARVKASKRPISLKHYSAKLGGRKGHKRVVINVTGERKVLEHAFILPSKGGHVFERVGDNPLPIKRLSGPSLGSALERKAIATAMRQVVATRWPAVYRRELNYALSKLPRR